MTGSPDGLRAEPSYLGPEWAAAGALALVVAAAGPLLRTLFPILYVIGEDWSYPGVGAVGLLLYLSPLLAVLAFRARPRTAVRLGAAMLLAAAVGLVAVAPISRYVAAAATVLALVGVTLVAQHLAAAGSGRRLLLVGAVVGLTLDTAVRGLLITWDLVWRAAGLASALSLLVPATAVLLAWWATRRDPPRTAVEPASRSAVVGIGGLIALAALFLQNPGYVSAMTGWPFWAGVAVVLLADALALVGLAAAAARAPHALVVGLLSALAAVSTVLVTVAAGAVSSVLVVVAWAALVALVSVALAADPAHPTRAPWLAGPARAAGAAAFGLAVVFLWQFYIDTALPFPRWAIALLPVLVVAGSALLAVRRDPGGAPAARRPALMGALAATAAAVVCAAFLVATTPAGSSAAASGRTVTVMTYNIRSASDVDGQIRPDVVADIVREFDPDVLLLQETGRGWPIHASTDVAAVLERELGYAAAFMGSADDTFGNVVLSRLPFDVTATGYLPDVGGQRRSYIAVMVDVGGSPLLVVNSHLEDRSVPQIEALLAVAGDTSPAVVLGDLNTWPDLEEAAAFTATGLVDVVDASGDVCRTTSAQPTRPCDRPDWILVTPDLAIDAVSIGTVPASDHLPIVATLTLP
ncbi:endonuclease/exonuclease/phosphatase family protein [Longivirga aurantiaca]|uniref:Endonuclease/exonuclease/phosphatase family protein n=1 Tax=Longivirga aurantiaca TaxID=1837743 RepID=A0ABW1SWQ1_9ACTN